MNIYVGNLPYNVTEDELQERFAEYGEVSNVNMITDKLTGQSKGFAFVEMTKQVDAEEAIKVLNGSTLNNRELKVNQARPKEKNSYRSKRY
ncbi:MAG: RNA-binding protein [Thiomargarita sp.]|nr:RNA-binding protein [Thiomargarita sp.]